jgi:2-(1,2-epoxy-1,2-dihydrophenyl)acetyl-CoA isomerase
VEEDLVLYAITEGVALLTLNRPERLNAINPPMLQRWVECLAQAEADKAVRAIVITGAGRGFCSGGDVGKLAQAAGVKTAGEQQGGGDKNEAADGKGAGKAADKDTGAQPPLKIKEGLRRGVQRIPLLLQRMDKPVIAAINGDATGAGLDAALMCDIRFAAASARLGETYSKLGLLPGAGGAWFLPRIVGAAKALELFWSAELIGAEEALRIGLVNRVLPDDQLLDKTLEFATRVAAAPPLSIRMLKRAVYQGLTLELATHLELISSHMVIARSSNDHAEAIQARKERRQPRYEGR